MRIGGTRKLTCHQLPHQLIDTLTEDYLMITESNLKEYMTYNPDTGLLVWKKSSGGITVGSEVGSVQKIKHLRYRTSYFNGKACLVHRIIHFYVLGEMPNGEIDHIDGNGLNNKWSNLRVVNHKDNLRNQKLSNINKSGHAGVCWIENRQRWHAQIAEGGRRIFLGRFKDKNDAISARETAEREFGYHENHGKR